MVDQVSRRPARRAAPCSTAAAAAGAASVVDGDRQAAAASRRPCDDNADDVRRRPVRRRQRSRRSLNNATDSDAVIFGRSNGAASGCTGTRAQHRHLRHQPQWVAGVHRRHQRAAPASTGSRRQRERRVRGEHQPGAGSGQRARSSCGRAMRRADSSTAVYAESGTRARGVYPAARAARTSPLRTGAVLGRSHGQLEPACMALHRRTVPGHRRPRPRARQHGRHGNRGGLRRSAATSQSPVRQRPARRGQGVVHAAPAARPIPKNRAYVDITVAGGLAPTAAIVATLPDPARDLRRDLGPGQLPDRRARPGSTSTRWPRPRRPRRWATSSSAEPPAGAPPARRRRWPRTRRARPSAAMRPRPPSARLRSSRPRPRDRHRGHRARRAADRRRRAAGSTSTRTTTSGPGQQYAIGFQAGDPGVLLRENYRTEHPPLAKIVTGSRWRRSSRSRRSPTAHHGAAAANDLPEPRLIDARPVSPGGVRGRGRRSCSRSCQPARRAVARGPHLDDQVHEPGHARGGAGVLRAARRASPPTRAWRAGSSSSAAPGRVARPRPRSRSASPARGKYLYGVAGLAIVADWLLRWRAGERVPARPRRPGRAGLAAWLRSAGWVAVAVVAFLAADPYLWPDPVGRLAASLGYHGGYATQRGGPGRPAGRSGSRSSGWRAPCRSTRSGHVPRRRSTC